LPYGGRSNEAIYKYTKQAIEYLFKNDCKLIIIACNTATSSALRLLQQTYLPKHYPDRRILGVIAPTVEIATEKHYKTIGVLATSSTVSSKVYDQEIKKIDATAKMLSNDAPLLVPLIENNGKRWARPILKTYLAPLLKEKINALLLGCTHYPYLKKEIKRIVGKDVKIISQDEFIPEKLMDYLQRHPEIEKTLTKTGTQNFYVTDLTSNYISAAQKLYGTSIEIKQANKIAK
jgi:glutamate racemase